MTLITFTTGNFYTPKKYDLNKCIKLASKLDIDGIELGVITVKTDLVGFKFTRENLKFLKSLKFNTIHAPVFITGRKRCYYSLNNQTKKILNKLYQIYDKIEAKDINFHFHNMNSFRLFKNKDYVYSIENSAPKHKIKLSQYMKVLKEYPDLRFVLDVAHVQESSIKHVANYVKTLKDRIIYTHLSANEHRKEHLPLHMVSKQLLRRLNILKTLKTPFCIETWSPKPDIKIFKKEIKFLRKWTKT